jgi:Zn-dependent M28 family amino/carboxypeptidase
MKNLCKLFLLFCLTSASAQNLVDTSSARQHLLNIIKTQTFRNHKNPPALNQVAAYIQNEFSKYADHVSVQTFMVNGIEYRNIICSFDTLHEERIIIGAHYDVCGDQDGADDNASGVVGILELAKLLKGKKLSSRIDLVAYSLEEPPYFESENMGSYVHAKYLKENKIKVRGVIAFDMIAYFSDEKNSQRFPAKFLKLFYGGKANFITVVQKFHNGKFPNKFKRKMKRHANIRTRSFKGPASMSSIGLSDHWSYWQFGFSALLVSDTSFFRNKNYHERTDTIETLDIYRMCRVIDSVYQAILHMQYCK